MNEIPSVVKVAGGPSNWTAELSKILTGIVKNNPDIIKNLFPSKSMQFGKAFSNAFGSGRDMKNMGSSLGGAVKKVTDTVIAHPWRAGGVAIGVPLSLDVLRSRLKGENTQPIYTH